MIFTHSPIKAWQAVLALLFLTLPCPINLISQAFGFTVETGLGNRTGRSCQSIQLTHPVWSEVSASPGDHAVQITYVVFDLSCSKYLSLLCLWRAYFESEYILIASSNIPARPLPAVCIVGKDKTRKSISFSFQNHQSVTKESFATRIVSV